MNPKLAAAKKYISESISILPWHYVDGQKRPALRWKELQERRWTVEEAEDWWSHSPNHNVGAITGSISDLIIVDADDDSAITWVENNLPETSWVVITGRGMQYGYRHPGEQIRNRAKINGMNLDIRGDGGYVAMPPSQHKTGSVYAWVPGIGRPTSNMPVYDPSWIPTEQTPQLAILPGGKVDKDKAFMRAERWMAKRDPAIEGSGGDQHTYITACYLVRDFGLPQSAALELMQKWNATCQPQWSDNALIAKLQSALRSGQAAIGSKETRKPMQAPDFSDWSDNLKNIDTLNLPLNDYGNSQRFASKFKHIIRYCYDEKSWYVWDGIQWKADESGSAMRLAKSIPSLIHTEARQLTADAQTARHKHAFKTGGANGLSAMLALAASEPGIPALTSDFDQQTMLVNTPSGIIDLVNGKLLQPKPEMMQNQITTAPYRPDAECPLWEKFVDQIFQGNKELIRYMQQLAGYSLTGSINEHIFIYCYGGGRNGKSTFINTLIKIFGDYAGGAPPNLLISKRNDPHPTELAFLRKLRMALGGEVKPGERLDEGKLKHLTGGEKITARTMRKDFSQFTPTHTLWLAGNLKLKIYATDIGMWERIKLIPFNALFTGKDRDVHLPDKLLEEAPGILRWAVKGCIDWNTNGFKEPEIVTKATSQYRADENLFQQWLNERTEKADYNKTTHKDLRSSYIYWCEDNQIKNPYSTRAFTNAMREAGYERSSGGTRSWKGISVKVHI